MLDPIEDFFTKAINGRQRRFPAWTYPEYGLEKRREKRPALDALLKRIDALEGAKPFEPRRPSYAEIIMPYVNRQTCGLYGLKPCYLRRIEK